MSVATFLVRAKQSFFLLGVDVLVQEQVQIMLSNLDVSPGQNISLVQSNSLDVFPKLAEQGAKFDLLLIDGDHNYHTVQQELKYVEQLCYPKGIVLIDDYDGRWADKDLWYSERPGYEKVDAATRPVQTEKHGVKAAVDEWLSANPQWKSRKLMEGEPILLSREDI